MEKSLNAKKDEIDFLKNELTWLRSCHEDSSPDSSLRQGADTWEGLKWQSGGHLLECVGGGG